LIAKRGLDLTIAILALILASPLIVAVSILIFVRLGRPVFFRQQRPGINARPFYVYKFRTMMLATHRDGRQLTDSERMGRLGKLVRRLSLDELPQLWNVIRGDMSLVGPRPLLMKYLPYFTEEERIRFQVRPGITGWAQIRGRNHSSWSQRFADDVWYVRNWSLWLDLKILAITIKRVLRSEGVANDARAVMLNLDEERADMVDRAGVGAPQE
jgi:sugar transferase EpsL